VRRLEAGNTPSKHIHTTQITPYHPYTPPKPQSKTSLFSVSDGFRLEVGWWWFEGVCEVSVCLGRQVIGWVDMRRLEAGHTPRKHIYTTQITPYHPYNTPKPQSKTVSFPFLKDFGWWLVKVVRGCVGVGLARVGEGWLG
jgi:hypothetical protein